MRAKYVPDLSKQQALCAANYARLLKLMPDINECDRREFHVSLGDQAFHIAICVQERFAFTTTVTVSQTMSQQVEWINAPNLSVRLYHDANMAEVISPNSGAQLLGKYSYPNDKMYQVDEKLQLNEHLAQWLGHALAQGYQKEDVLFH
ncbi:MAG: DUF1249 domain-containing protein [Pseudomonadales bacterium]